MSGWATPRIIAAYVHRPEATIRQWAKNLDVPTACDLRTRKLIVHVASAGALARERGERWRARRKVA